MARIRTIKPEFWTSEQVMECSPLARLLFIGIWNFCDDAGNHPASAITIKALVFPGDAVASDDIRRMLEELSASGLLSFYSASGKQYLHVNGWAHQKIDRPTVKFPPFDPEQPGEQPPPPPSNDGMRGAGHVVDDASPSDHGALDEDSANARLGLTPGREGEGEGIGKYTLTPGAPFEMFLKWVPDENTLKAYALMSGVPVAVFTRDAMSRFICHHHAKGTCKTEKEWVSELVGWVRNDLARAARVVPLARASRGAAADIDFEATGWLGGGQ